MKLMHQYIKGQPLMWGAPLCQDRARNVLKLSRRLYKLEQLAPASSPKWSGYWAELLKTLRCDTRMPGCFRALALGSLWNHQLSELECIFCILIMRWRCVLINGMLQVFNLFYRFFNIMCKEILPVEFLEVLRLQFFSFYLLTITGSLHWWAKDRIKLGSRKVLPVEFFGKAFLEMCCIYICVES